MIQVDATNHPGANFTSVRCYFGGADGPIIGPGQILVDTSTARCFKSNMVSSGGVDVHTVAVPLDATIVGLKSTIQGIIAGGRDGALQRRGHLSRHLRVRRNDASFSRLHSGIWRTRLAPTPAMSSMTFIPTSRRSWNTSGSRVTEGHEEERPRGERGRHLHPRVGQPAQERAPGDGARSG